jgi:hypothetical protein
MATPILDAQRLREILDYDIETGIFRWKTMLAHRRKPGDVAGSLTHGYIEIGISNQRYRAHHLAWLYVTGSWPALDIDHKDGIRKNNAFANLRQVSNQKNAQNRHQVSSRKTSTPFLGVTWNKSRQCWMAQIRTKDGKNLNLGLYDNDYQAHIAYLYAKREHHEDATIASVDLPPKPEPRNLRRRTSKVNGVSFDNTRMKWCAKVRIDGRYRHLGYFLTEQEAIHAVQQNTSPAFPPVPQQPEAGMTGIETPEVADNLPA